MITKLGQVSTETQGCSAGIDADSKANKHKQYTNGEGDVSDQRSPLFPFTVAGCH